MNIAEIRTKYLEYFKARKHVVIPSAPLVPQNDPTTLVVCARLADPAYTVTFDTLVPDADIAVVEYALNTRPRKRLKWRTPLEARGGALRG